jgi:hypothetical protein
MAMATVIWREWYNAAAVKKLTEMGTLPRNEIEIDDFYMDDGDTVACIIAETANKQDGECFREGGELTIVEPASIAGDYEISVDYEPVFSAYRSENFG